MNNFILRIKILIYNIFIVPYIQYKEKNELIKNTIEWDKIRLLKYGFSYSSSEENLLANLRMKIHFLEKGLTMPIVRPCFGIMRLKQIADIVKKLGHEKANKFEMQYAYKLMNEYIQYHKLRDIELPQENLSVIEEIIRITRTYNANQTTQQRHYKKSEYFNIADGSFTQIAQSRHSVRNYINKPIDQSIFEHIAQIANTAPSACNRQPCRMHIVTNRHVIDSIFSLGIGCNGFGHLAPALIIITSDLECRDNITERFQVGVDAGFYGMNVLYALHEKQIGACVLNWDNIKVQDQKIRKLLPSIKDSETILFFISCGYTPEEFDIPLGLKKTHV